MSTERRIKILEDALERLVMDIGRLTDENNDLRNKLAELSAKQRTTDTNVGSLQGGMRSVNKICKKINTDVAELKLNNTEMDVYKFQYHYRNQDDEPGDPFES